jgi:hypothetical protein
MLTIAENFAASQVLTEWPEGLTYDELCTAIEEDSQDVLVYCLFEDSHPADIVQAMDDLRVSFMRSVEQITEPLRDSIREGEAMNISDELYKLERSIGA